jgi:hypothetical protein
MSLNYAKAAADASVPLDERNVLESPVTGRVQETVDEKRKQLMEKTNRTLELTNGGDTTEGGHQDASSGDKVNLLQFST